jgi:hypothetical protein
MATVKAGLAAATPTATATATGAEFPKEMATVKAGLAVPTTPTAEPAEPGAPAPEPAEPAEPPAAKAPAAPSTPPRRVRPSTTIKMTPERPCILPMRHEWEPQTSGVYVSTGRLSGLSCISTCGQMFVATRPVSSEVRKIEFHPTGHRPAQLLCKKCSRGMCFDCELEYTEKTGTPDSGRRSRSRTNQQNERPIGANFKLYYCVTFRCGRTHIACGVVVV